MRTISDLVADHPFFAGLPAAVTAMLAGCAHNAVHAEGTLVFREGGPADTFHLIRHGAVALEVSVPTGAPFRFATLGRGDVLGVSWLVPDYRSDYDARVIKPLRALTFDAACLRGKCDADPAVGYLLMKRFVPVLAERLKAARFQAMDVYA